VTIKRMKLSVPSGFQNLTGEGTEEPKPSLGQRVSRNLAGMKFSYSLLPFEIEFPRAEKSVPVAGIGATAGPAKGDYIAILQPDDTFTAPFKVKAGSHFGSAPRPDTYTIDAQVEYLISDKTHNEATQMDLSIFASISGMLSGAVLGSVIGTVLRLTAAPSISPSFLWTLLGSIIVGFMSAILLMRKKDVQPLVTIEDFWGGIVIGFLSSYLGSQFLQQLLPKVS